MKKSIALPNARIKSIAYSDPDVSLLQKDAVVAIGQIVSMFCKGVLGDCAKIDTDISPSVLHSTITSNDTYDFLRPLLSSESFKESKEKPPQRRKKPTMSKETKQSAKKTRVQKPATPPAKNTIVENTTIIIDDDNYDDSEE